MSERNDGIFRKLTEECKTQGWTIEKTHGGHWRFTSHLGYSIFHSFSPSDSRAFKNFVSRLRRQGLIWRH